MPGLAKACNPNLDVPAGAVYLYSQSWTVSTVVAGTVYLVCHKLSPMPITSDKDGDWKVIEGIGKETDVETEMEGENFDEKPAVGKVFDV